MGWPFTDKSMQCSSRTHWKHTAQCIPCVEALPFLFFFFFLCEGYLREGACVVGSNLHAATFLRVRGTMSGNESSPRKCPVLERVGCTTLFSCDATPNISYTITPAGRLLFFIPSTDKMAGLCAMAFASGGVVLCFDSSSEKPSDLSALFLQSASFLLSFWHLGRKMGQCNTHCSPEGDVVIGQLFEGLLVKCKRCVASTRLRQLCFWFASPSGCGDYPSKM